MFNLHTYLSSPKIGMLIHQVNASCQSFGHARVRKHARDSGADLVFTSTPNGAADAPKHHCVIHLHKTVKLLP